MVVEKKASRLFSSRQQTIMGNFSNDKSFFVVVVVVVVVVLLHSTAKKSIICFFFRGDGFQFWGAKKMVVGKILRSYFILMLMSISEQELLF
jgi:hypothetical protein